MSEQKPKNKKSVDKVFWENVTRRLKEKKVTLAQAERELGMTKSYISHARLKNFIPKGETIEKIANYLDVEYIELFEDWTLEEWKRGIRER